MFVKKIFLILPIFLLFTSCSIEINSASTDEKKYIIPVLSVDVTPDRMEMLLSQKLLNYEVPATWHYLDTHTQGIIRPQGAGSRYYPWWSYTFFSDEPMFSKNSLFILSAQSTDKTKLRTMLMTFLCNEFGVLAPASELVLLRLNGEDKGVYVKSERIDEWYFQRHSLPAFELIKVMCSAKFSSYDPDALYSFDWVIPELPSKTFFIEFMHALDTVSVDETLWKTVGRQYLDIPQYLRFHALNVVVNNVDGLNNNFYFYRPTPTSCYTIITHDFDNTFSMMREVSIEAENEIISKLLQNDSCRKLYYGYIRELVEKYFVEEKLFHLIDKYMSSIREANKDVAWWDEAAFYSEVQYLKQLISKRRQYLNTINHLLSTK